MKNLAQNGLLQGLFQAALLLMVLAPARGEEAATLALRDQVAQILTGEDTRVAVESLIGLGPKAEPVLLEFLYEHPQEVLGALEEFASQRSTFPLLTYLFWAQEQCPSESPSEIGVTEYFRRNGVHCSAGVSDAVEILERLADRRSIDFLAKYLIDPSVEPAHQIGVAAALLAFEEPEARQKGSDFLLSSMLDSTIDLVLRLSAAVSLVKKGVPSSGSRARDWILAVAEGFLGYGEPMRVPEGGPVDHWYKDFTSHMIDALEELQIVEADELFRSFLLKGWPMSYEGTRVVEILLEDPSPLDEAAVLTWGERLLGPEYIEPLLAIETLGRVGRLDEIHDPQRFVELVSIARETPAAQQREYFRDLLDQLDYRVDQIERERAEILQ